MADFGFFRPTLDALADIASMDEPVEVRRDLLKGVYDRLAAGDHALAERTPVSDDPIPLAPAEDRALAYLRVLRRSGRWGEITGS